MVPDISVASLNTGKNISKWFLFGIIYRKLLYVSLHYFLKSHRIIVYMKCMYSNLKKVNIYK